MPEARSLDLNQAVPRHTPSKRTSVRAVMLAVTAIGGRLERDGETGWLVLGRGIEGVHAWAERGARLP